MQQSEQEQAQLCADIASYQYEVWMIKNARKYDLKNSEYHPNRYKETIERCKQILKASEIEPSI